MSTVDKFKITERERSICTGSTSSYERKFVIQFSSVATPLPHGWAFL